jgi:hypothetical protein
MYGGEKVWGSCWIIEIFSALLGIKWSWDEVCKEESLVKRMKAYNGRTLITI